MSKKDKKRAMKRARRLEREMNTWAYQQIADYGQSTMTVEFIHDGKIYKGVVPCVGEVEK